MKINVFFLDDENKCLDTEAEGEREMRMGRDRAALKSDYKNLSPQVGIWCSHMGTTDPAC
jgi:hypothetical protein